MLGRLILLFIIGGMAELYILIKIGSHIGGFNTILLVLMTAVSGRFAGASAKFAHFAANSIKPVARPNSGGGIDRRRADSFGGILFVMPGVLTDLFALVLLLPLTRTYFKRWLRRRFDRMVAGRDVRLQYHRGGF